MKTEHFAPALLESLFEKQKVATLPELQSALGCQARMTVFRKLNDLRYLSSYSHAGKYYTLPKMVEFNDKGLWLETESPIDQSTLPEIIKNSILQNEKIKHIYKIEKADGTIHFELEVLKGQRNALGQQTAFSTVNIDFVPVPLVVTTGEVLETVQTWSPVLTFNAALDVLLALARTGLDVLIWLLTFITVVLIDRARSRASKQRRENPFTVIFNAVICKNRFAFSRNCYKSFKHYSHNCIFIRIDSSNFCNYR